MEQYDADDCHSTQPIKCLDPPPPCLSFGQDYGASKKELERLNVALDGDRIAAWTRFR